jgi:GT2 family glycosyltransferase
LAREADPRLSVVIATLGRQAKLERALEHLAALTDEDFDVIVVSDALDPDPQTTAARSLGVTGWRHLQAARPGASAARNAGWRASRAPLILFVDDDILAERGLVDEHVAGHTAEPDERTCVLGCVRWARSVRVTPFMRWLDERGLQFDYAGLSAGQDAGWGRMYTANVSVKRSLLERLDGFDEVAFPYLYEDLDLARRAHEAGGLVVRYRPQASAEHLGASTLADWLGRVERLAVAERTFVDRYPDVPPHFHEIFTRVARERPARGRGRRLTAIPRSTPWLGPRIWASADAAAAQVLAAPFLAAWDRVGG